MKDTHRGLWYEDGVLTKVLEAGRYEVPKRQSVFGGRKPYVEISLVDLGKNGNARIYIGFDKHAEGNGVPASRE